MDKKKMLKTALFAASLSTVAVVKPAMAWESMESASGLICTSASFNAPQTAHRNIQSVISKVPTA